MAELTSAESKVYEALLRLADRWNEVNATMIELAEETGYGRTSLSQAVAGLRIAGLIQVTRTKRNLGKLYKNRYKIIDRTSTASTIDTVDTTSYNTLAKNTTYSLEGEALKEDEMVNKWSDDDDLGGFGLFDSEVTVTQPKANKRNPKTRHQRPTEEWTAVDVATEFSSRVYARIKDAPVYVNTKALWGALAANRKKYNLNAVIEIEVMDKFFADERNIAALRKAPTRAHGVFLNAIATYTPDVVSDLDLEVPTEKQEETVEYVYASDGTAFDNSMLGRLELAEYESSIK